jgi:hypothetical protein
MLYYKVMQIVPEIVRTCRPTMAIKDTKEANLWPLNVNMSLALRLENVQDDAHPVLIVISDDPLVGVGSI